MKKLLLLLLIAGLGAVFLLYGGYSSALRYALNPSGTGRVTITIPEGATGSDIAELLYGKDLIKSVPAFNFYLRQHELGDKMKAGRFVFQEDYNLPKIVDILVTGKSSEFAVTLLEGWTIKQMAEELESEELTTAGEFMTCLRGCKFEFDFLPSGYLEGYLYPDTYFVNPGTYSNEEFITRLIGTLNNKLTEEDWSAIGASKRDFDDIMIMASIVEREERSEKERPVVAGILWNRIDSGTGLYADATILYGLGRAGGGLTAEDLALDSPYNTRKYRGLPPTPICNPSISSIHAALYPAETDYWYYLHDKDGQIHYAGTLDEHNVNKAKYIR